MTARVGGSSDVGKVSITVSVTAKVGGCRGGVCSGKVTVAQGEGDKGAGEGAVVLWV